MQPPAHIARRFGKAVKEVRLKRGLTQEQLADACGLDISYIGQIERGQRNPTLGVMHAIATVLKVKLADLLKMAKLLPEPYRGREFNEGLSLFLF